MYKIRDKIVYIDRLISPRICIDELKAPVVHIDEVSCHGV